MSYRQIYITSYELKINNGSAIQKIKKWFDSKKKKKKMMISKKDSCVKNNSIYELLIKRLMH